MTRHPASWNLSPMAGRGRSYLFLVLLCLVFFVPGFFNLPPVDRDEARYAQASSQMIETGDYVRINFQQEARNKKPIGIYWLQAASAAICGSAQHRKIWPYRIPSFLGAIFSVLLMFAMGKRLFGERAGMLGAALGACSFLLVMEAHLATTDAMLLTTVMASQAALSKFYLRADDDTPPGTAAFLTFWTAQAVGILIKGPVTPMISLLTMGCLAATDRNVGWMRGMKPLRGLAIVAALASPWAIAIGLATGGAFFRQALGGDFLSKVASGQESHGFPPGYYLLLMPLTLWPASALAGVSIFRAWKSRSTPAVRFCLAWIIPAWILFELVPTKLPHYVLPLYPPLCLLIAHAIVRSEDDKTIGFGSKLVKSGYLSCQLVIVFLSLGVAALTWFPDHHFRPLGLVPVALAIAGTALSTWKFFKRRYVHATAVAIATTALVLAPAFQWVLPDADWLWLSRNVANAAKLRSSGNVMLCSSGYDEPSLVFLLGTSTLLTSPSGAAGFLRTHPEALALIATHEDEDFKRRTLDQGVHVCLAGAFCGFNYSKGHMMLLRFYGTCPKERTGDGPQLDSDLQ